MALAKFMASVWGRLIRIIVGAVLIYGGYLGVKGTVGDVLVIVGLVPFLAGAFDVCLLAPLFGGPLSGKAARAANR